MKNSNSLYVFKVLKLLCKRETKRESNVWVFPAVHATLLHQIKSDDSIECCANPYTSIP